MWRKTEKEENKLPFTLKGKGEEEEEDGEEEVEQKEEKDKEKEGNRIKHIGKKTESLANRIFFTIFSYSEMICDQIFNIEILGPVSKR